MNIASGIYVAVAILVTAVAWIAVGRRRSIRTRSFAVILVALLLPTGFAAVMELMSRPKPVAAEWIERKASEAVVLSSVIADGNAIFLWLQLPSHMEPRAYTLPWDEELAQELTEAQAEGEATEQAVSMRNPFRRTNEPEADPVFYVSPPESLPPKTPVVESPQRFEG